MPPENRFTLSLPDQIERRRTFAIISHPDAGKTTLTEKLLLYGGAIQVAGAVKSNKVKKTAASDFMEIEKQRGISVATSVMAFEYGGKLINLLDTPGHKDFAEDTYRTLTAVDSVVLVIDCVKGVEEQTERLMEVCRMRDTPVIIFINKLDREGRDPFELLDELEAKLDIKVRPLSWPIDMGTRFKGVYNLHSSALHLFTAGSQTVEEGLSLSIDDPRLDQAIGKTEADTLRSEVELIEGVYDPFDKEQYLAGKLAPVFFGSAINNFGVRELLETFIEIAPAPAGGQTTEGHIPSDAKDFSGFIFKIHANIDPNHRNRIAFLRVTSGTFERNRGYKHVRLGKEMKFSNPYAFLAQKKNVVDEAFPGDVIGLYDTGNFKIGDALTSGKELHFKGMPSFSPEIFREVVNKDPMKSKQLDKGVTQLMDEGVAQLFTQQPGNRKIIGTVGELQFEVIKYRLQHEYGAAADFSPIPCYRACWMTSDNPEKIAEFTRRKHKNIYHDKDGNPVFLAESSWLLNMAKEDFPEIEFHNTSEFKLNGEQRT